MKNVLLVLAAAAAFGSFAVEYPGNMNFRNVSITNAAQHRTDWRINEVNWDTADSLGPGVDYLPVKFTAAGGWPRLIFAHFARIDLTTPGLRFTGVDRAEGWGVEPMIVSSGLKRTVLEKTGDFIARYRGARSLGGKARNMILAWNATGWGPFSGGADDRWADINGPFYSDGVQISRIANGNPTYPGAGILVIYKDCTIDMVETLPASDVGRVWFSVPGFRQRLVKDGARVNLADESFTYQVRPRTALGFSKDRRYVYVIVVDGDNYNSGFPGCDIATLQDFQLLAGVYQGFNSDGGGSSNMVSWDSALNCPRVMGAPGGGYSVSNQRDGGSNIGVYVAPEFSDVDGAAVVEPQTKPWFSADVAASAVSGGDWTVYGDSNKVFAADSAAKGGFARMILDFSFQENETYSLSEKKMADILSLDPLPKAVLVSGYDEKGGNPVWKGLVKKAGEAAFVTLRGEIAPAPGDRMVVVQEIDSRSGTARVRYYAGSYARGTAFLLADDDGDTEFDCAGVDEAALGTVKILGYSEVTSLNGAEVVSRMANGLIIRFK